MADHRVRHHQLSQRVTNTTCPHCAAPVIQFVEHGCTYHLDANQAPINRTPIEHERASPGSVWRLNLSTKRWGYEPAAPRGADPVHLVHVCPTVGRSQAQEGAQAI